MGKRIDLAGKRFGKLIVITQSGSDNFNNIKWLCRCDCGKEKIISGSSLRHKLTTSCGCYGIQKLLDHKNITHGLYGEKGSSERRLHNIWAGMKDRCLNPNTERYSRYGGLGITVYKEWVSNYKSFYDWSINNGYTDTLTIDRIENDGNYTPSNCQWISKSENSIKKRTTIFISINGVQNSVTKWASIAHKDLHALLRYYKANGHDNTSIYLMKHIEKLKENEA